MRKTVVLLLALALSTLAFGEDEKKDTSKAEDRIQAAATVLDEIESAPDKGIPEEVLGSAECVAVVPSLLKGGFIVGADYGRGVASCRTTSGWSAPAFLFTSGGSLGFQIGGQAIDLVMLIMNKDGAEKLLSSKFKLGADASVAAGPVGRHAAADTDWKMRAPVIKQDKDATREFYGRMVPFRTSLTGKVEAPHAAFPFLDTLAKWAKKAAADEKSAEKPKTKPAEKQN
jgi:lipid-binding SYLF domain-containing protein